MSKNKKLSLVALLLSVYALLLFHEVMVNPVFCHKNDGSADLELAILGFQCECRDINDHSHSHRCKPENCSRFSPQFFDCFDLPLGDAWLKRNITKNTFEFEINSFNQCDPYVQIKLQLNDPFGRFIESIPLSKFLEKILTERDCIVLRC